MLWKQKKEVHGLVKKITLTNYSKTQELLWLFSRFAKRTTCVLIGSGCSFDQPLAAPFLPFAVFGLAFDPLCGLIRIRHLITFKPYEQPWEQASKFLHSNTVPAYVYILHTMHLWYLDISPLDRTFPPYTKSCQQGLEPRSLNVMKKVWYKWNVE